LIINGKPDSDIKKSFRAEQIARHSLLTLTLHKKSKQILSVIHTECYKNSCSTHDRGTLLVSWQTDRISSFILDELREYAKSTFNKIAVTRGPNCFLATSAAMFQRSWAMARSCLTECTRGWLPDGRQFAISIYIAYSSLICIAYCLQYKNRCWMCAAILAMGRLHWRKCIHWHVRLRKEDCVHV